MNFNILLQSWIEVEKNSDFPIQNIPFGIFKTTGGIPHAATRIGDTVIDLYALASNGFLDGSGIEPDLFNCETLNPFIALGKPAWRTLRENLGWLFEASNPALRDRPEKHAEILVPINDVQMLMPVQVGDYTDFYSSIEHATNVGTMFRDPEHALLPNWRHMPVGYHGRSSSIVISRTNVHRPNGQQKSDTDDFPEFGPSKQVDFELEMAFITGQKTGLGQSVSTSDAGDHIFGMVIFNDLSARDIQKWEYVPLGPFLAKSFGSVISPWIVTLDALEPFRVKGPLQDPAVLSYLQFDGNHNFDIQLEVAIQPENQDETLVCHSNFKYMYWNMVQQLAHQTVNGCNINVGDMYGSGTISGPTPNSFGSMLEIAWKGTKPVKMSDGTERKFIHDNDTIIMRGYCEKDGLRIGFGEVATKILPAIQTPQIKNQKS
ncbi:MAG: fumarylacetoacetase [Bacteroidales bacterium]|nr:fumarylacetoacetase [Bacteroidales bacterium]